MGLGMNLPMIIFFAAFGVGFTTLLWFYFSTSRRAPEPAPQSEKPLSMST
jgi:hypothetical protein